MNLPLLEPTTKGLVNALLTVALATLGFCFFLGVVPPASPELLRTIAVIGASFLLAYVIEAVWLAGQAELDDEYEEWLGFATGTGIAGLLGIVLALLLAEHRATGHDNLVDQIGTAWVAVSLFTLAAAVVAHPLLAARYRRV